MLEFVRRKGLAIRGWYDIASEIWKTVISGHNSTVLKHGKEEKGLARIKWMDEMSRLSRYSIVYLGSIVWSDRYGRNITI